MKKLLVLLGIAVCPAALLLALVLLVAGYFGLAALIGGVSVAGIAGAAWCVRPRRVAEPERAEWFVWDEPLEPELSPTEEQMLRFGFVGDPVDVHQAQMARALARPTTFGMARNDNSEPTFVWFPDAPGRQ